MNTMLRIIARRMSESAYTAPHINLLTDIWIEPLLGFRNDMIQMKIALEELVSNRV